MHAETRTPDDVNMIALVKGSDRYFFFYRDDQRQEMLRVLGRYASDSELNLTWHDAAVLSQKVRRGIRSPFER